MTKRYLLVTLFILIISLVVFIPQHPAVRGWLLERVRSVVLDAGYDLQVQRVTGNPWFGLGAEGLSLEGAGIALSADRAQVRYTLPALIIGRLPLSIQAGRVTGSVDFAALELPTGDGRPAAVKVTLRELALADVDVAAVNVPFTLPDIRLQGLRASTNRQGIDFTSEVVTPDGALEATGELQLSPFVLEADVTRADVRIARQWWDGITGGTVTGQVRVADGQVSAVADVTGGSIRFLDEDVTDISGRATYTHPNVQASLSGQILGGEVVADGGVAIDNRRWFGEAEGTVDLKAVSTWLMTGRVPFDPEIVPLGGQADVTVQAAGWQDALVRGRGQGAGELAGYPLENLLAEFVVDTPTGVSVSSSTLLADGLVTAELTPVDEGFQLALAADGVNLTPTLAAGGTFDLSTFAGALEGIGNLELAGELLEMPAIATIALALQDGDWRTAIEGNALNGELSGEANLLGGLLTAHLDLAEARLPLVTQPLNLSVRADGPLDALPLVLQLDASESVSVALPGVDAATDLRGEMTATLRGAFLQEIAAALGSLSASGDLSLAPLAGALDVSLSQIPVSGVVTGSAALPEGRLELDGSALRLTGDVVTESLVVPGVGLPDLAGVLELTWQDDAFELTLSDPAQGVVLSYADDTLAAQFDTVALGLAGQPVSLTGTASLEPSAALASLAVDAQLSSAWGEAVLTGEAGQLQAQFVPALTPGGVLSGDLDMTSGVLALSGQLAELMVTGEGQLFDPSGEQPAPRLNARIEGGTDSLQLRYQAGEITVDGALDIAALAPLVPLDASGRVTAELALSDGIYTGRVSAQGEALSVPFDLQLTGAGNALDLSGTARPFDIPVELAGQLAPQLSLQATSEYGNLGLSGSTLSGSGVIPAVDIPTGGLAGFEISAQPWQLTGDLAAQQLRVNAGESAALLDWRSGWVLSADINQVAQGAAAQLVLTGNARLGDQQPEGTLSGVLTLATADGQAQFTVGGTLTDITLTGSTQASTITSALALPVTGLGLIDLDVRWQDGTLTADAAWQTAADTVQVSLRSTPEALAAGEVRLIVTSETLEGVLSTGSFSVTARNFDPAAFIAVPNLPESVSGTLSFTELNGWQGRLEVRQPGLESPLQLVGQQETLGVLGEVQLGPLNLAATGTVLPETRVDIQANVPEQATFSGVVAGPLQALELSGTLTTEALSVDGPANITVPAQQFSVTGGLADGLSVTVTSLAGDAVQLVDNTLSGTLTLPITLAEAPHALTLLPSGTPDTPLVAGTVTGPYASGDLWYSEDTLTTELTVQADPFIDLPLGARLEPLRLNATADTTLAWQLAAEGTLVRDGEAVPVQAQLVGQSTAFDGDIRAFVAGEQLPARVSVQGGAVAFSAQPDRFDLSSLQGFVDLPLTGVVSGEVSWRTAVGLTIDLAVQGSAFERPFDVTVRQSQNVPLSLTGEVDAVTVRLVQQGTERYRLELAAQWLQDAAFDLSLGERWELTGGGQLTTAGEPLPLELTGEYVPSAAQGALTLRYDQAQLDITVTQPADIWELSGALQLPDGPLPVTGSGQFRASLGDGTLEVAQLAFDGEAFDTALNLALSGEVFPNTRLQGELVTDLLGSVQLSLARQAEALRFDLALIKDDLTLRATVTDGLEFISLTGTGTLPLATGITLDSGLYWSPSEGFQGNAALETLLGADITLAAQLIGSDALTLEAQLARSEAQLGRVWLELASDVVTTGDLAAPVQLWLTSEPVVPALQATELSAEAGLLGTLAEPQLNGTLALTGGLSATGEIDASLAGVTLQLAGDGFRLTGGVSPEAWQLQLNSTDLVLDTLLPQLQAPRISGTVRAAQRWGEAPDVTTESLRLSLANSLVTGDFRYRGGEPGQGLRGRLNVEVDLRDILVLGGAAGQLTGQLAVDQSGTTPMLSGTLQAQQLTIAGSGVQLGGSVIVTGEVARPSVTARLAGAGDASGTLLASYRARDNALIASSDLQVGELRTNFSFTWEDERLSTSGSFSVGDYQFGFVPTTDGTVQLVGQGQLADWQLDIDPRDQTLRAVGNLASLQPNLAGRLNLVADARALTQPERDWLGGTLSQVKVAGVTLGDLQLTGSTSSEVVLTGAVLHANLSLAGTPPQWELTRLDLPLTDGTVVRGSGMGTLQAGHLALELETQELGEPVILPLTVAFDDGQLQLMSEGALLGGNLNLQATATPADGWQGDLVVSGVSLAGLTLSARGQISGALSDPQLTATTELLQAETQLTGELQAGLNEVSLSQTLVTPLLERPLTIEGQLLPATQVTLATSPNNRFTLALEEGQLRSTGRLQLQSSGVVAQLSGETEALIDLNLSYLGLPGLSLGTVFDGATPAELAQQWQQAGLVLSGREQTTGTVLVQAGDPLEMSIERLGYSSELGTFQLSASYDVGSATGTLSGNWQRATDNGPLPPWLQGLERLTFTAAANERFVRLDAQAPAGRGQLALIINRRTLAAELQARLSPDGGQAVVDLRFAPEQGITGSAEIRSFPLFAIDAVQAATLSATLQVDESFVTADGALNLGDGRLTLSGNLNLGNYLPAVFAASGRTDDGLMVRLQETDLDAIPWLRRELPYLEGAISGQLELSGGALRGEVRAPSLRVAERELPLELSLEGPLDNLVVEGQLAQHRLSASYQEGLLSAFAELERFPIEAFIEARLGEVDVQSEVTGALRLELTAGGQPFVRFASQMIVLERAGIRTEGQLSFVYEDGGLIIGEAIFEGDGRWQATGEISQAALNLRLNATDANFDPLLGLIPNLAAFDIGARGSVQVITTGSLAAPIIRATTPQLEVTAAGSSYRLEDTAFTVQDEQFVVSAQLSALAPLTGTLALSGGGQFNLVPFSPGNITLRFEGDTAVPVVGALAGISGAITASPETGWQLSTTGVLGQPFTLQGDLHPLDLRLTGQRLNLRAPNFFLNSSETDVNLRFFFDELFYLTGSLSTRTAQLSLQREGPPQTAEPTTSAAAERRRVLERIVFDGVVINAPQDIRFQENFGSGELALSATLRGNAAQPTLDGQASVVRGVLRFAGRDFTITQAQAQFEATRGIFPTLDITAQTTFDAATIERDANRVRSDANRLTLLANGGTVAVTLNLQGEIVATPTDERAFTVDITSTLSSNASLQEVGSAPRALTEPELFTLLTLGRLELNPQFAGGDTGLATAVAQGAIDTAIDLFILSELQQQIGQALGVDLFEIRTTPIGTLLTGGADTFGVSLRIGGYLSDEVFATYEIGSLSADRNVAFSNVFNVRYDLSPLEFQLVGRLDFLNDDRFTPITELSANVGYAFTPLIRLEGGVSLSNLAQGVRFGVSFRW